MATRQGKQETMTDQQVTGALVLAAMFVIFLGVWFFGHPDDRKNSLRRMGVVLRFCMYIGLYGAIGLYTGSSIGGGIGALVACLIVAGDLYLWSKAEQFE
jgi:hypothetical protein